MDWTTFLLILPPLVILPVAIGLSVLAIGDARKRARFPFGTRQAWLFALIASWGIGAGWAVALGYLLVVRHGIGVVPDSSS